VDDLLTRLRVVAPNSEEYLAMHSFWLKTEDDSCQQTMVAAQRLIEIYPNNLRGYTSLGWCKTATGHAEEEIPLQEKLIRLNPRSSYLYAAYWRMGYAATRLGRDREATIWLERSLAENPEGSDEFLRNAYRELAAAAGNVGDDTKARAALAALQKVNPFDTVRSQYPETSSAILVEQVKHYQEGLRRAGMRDHADEDADFSVPTTSVLQDHALGYTPLTVPGATTIRTADLPRLIKEQNPTILDTLLRPRWNSIPGALGLRSAGVGGSMSDAVEDRLRRKMAELSGGDLSRPIVTLGWNSERLTGYNLALRLVGLGYTNVFWYRGGMEAWQVAGYPEAELQTVEW
jgi:tetratricopeptide (TPR) repeat protein